MNKIEKLNNKLSSFFTKKKIRKEASAIGTIFPEISSPEDIEKSAPMTAQLLKLPKYQKVINELRNSSGVINYVTHDQYEPLTELLLKSAFPTNNNDVFASDPDNGYFVDAKRYFEDTVGEVTQGDPDSIKAAKSHMDKLFYGGQKTMADAWEEAKGPEGQPIMSPQGTPVSENAYFKALDLDEEEIAEYGVCLVPNVQFVKNNREALRQPSRGSQALPDNFAMRQVLDAVVAMQQSADGRPVSDEQRQRMAQALGPAAPTTGTILDLALAYKEINEFVESSLSRRKMIDYNRTILNEEDKRRTIRLVDHFSDRIYELSSKEGDLTRAENKELQTNIKRIQGIINSIEIVGTPDFIESLENIKNNAVSFFNSNRTPEAIISNWSAWGGTDGEGNLEGLKNDFLASIEHGSKSEDEVESIKRKFEDRKRKYEKQKRAIESHPAWKQLVLAGEKNRREDGFVHWNPIKDVTDQGDEVRDFATTINRKALEKKISVNDNKLAQLGEKIDRWLKSLRHYRTSDPELDQIRDRILKYFGFNPRENANIYLNHRMEIKNLREDFEDRSNRHGKVMVFNNVEESILSTRPGAVAETDAPLRYNFEGGTPFARLGSLMRSEDDKERAEYLSRNGKEPPKTYGRRAVVLISDEPLTGLSGSAVVVSVPNEPILEDESEVVVGNMLDAWEKKNKEFGIINNVKQIEENFSDQIDQIDVGNITGRGIRDPRVQLHRRKQKAINRAYKLIEERLGVVRLNSRKQMTQTLIGMSLTEAIATFKKMLIENTEEIIGEDGKTVSGLELHQGTIVKDLLDMYNEKNSKSNAMAIREPTIKFEDYAYKKEFTEKEIETKEGVKLQNWAARVGFIADQARNINTDQKRIELLENYITEQKVLLKYGKKDETTGEYTLLGDEERVAANANILNAEEQMDGLEKRVYNVMAKELPHFMILYGPPGTGKSIWADAFGDLMKFMIRQVDVSQFKTKWYGESGRNMDLFVEEMVSMKNTVYLFDEIDKQVSQSHGGSDTAESRHQVDKEMTGKLLNVLADKDAQKKMEDNNTYIIMTTNEIMYVNDALKSRTQGHVYYVPDPITPDVVETFLRNYMAQEYRQRPDCPPFNVWLGQGFDDGTSEVSEENPMVEGDDTPIQNAIPVKGLKACWDESIRLLSDENLSVRRVAEAFAARKVAFRDLEAIIAEAFHMHNAWTRYQMDLQQGVRTAPNGFPMTTNNLVGVSMYAAPQSAGNDASAGVLEYNTQLDPIRKKLRDPETAGFEAVEYEDPITKIKHTGYVISQTLKEEMGGEEINIQKELSPEEEQAVLEEWQIDQGSAAERMRQRVDESIQEETDETGEIETERTEAPVPSEDDINDEELEEDPIARLSSSSSPSDYFFKCLEKSGVIKTLTDNEKQAIMDNKMKKEAKIVPDEIEIPIIKKEAQTSFPVKPQKNIQENEVVGNKYYTNEALAERGVYYFEEGKIFVGPAKEGTPSQFLKLDNKQGKQNEGK